MKRYTNYLLTNEMLKRLSRIVNQDMRGLTGGQSAQALKRRGLVVVNPDWLSYREGQFWVATDAGKWALAEARKEGW